MKRAPFLAVLVALLAACGDPGGGGGGGGGGAGKGKVSGLVSYSGTALWGYQKASDGGLDTRRAQFVIYDRTVACPGHDGGSSDGSTQVNATVGYLFDPSGAIAPGTFTARADAGPSATIFTVQNSAFGYLAKGGTVTVKGASASALTGSFAVDLVAFADGGAGGSLSGDFNASLCQ